MQGGDCGKILCQPEGFLEVSTSLSVGTAAISFVTLWLLELGFIFFSSSIQYFRFIEM